MEGGIAGCDHGDDTLKDMRSLLCKEKTELIASLVFCRTQIDRLRRPLRRTKWERLNLNQSQVITNYRLIKFSIFLQDEAKDLWLLVFRLIEILGFLQ